MILLKKSKLKPPRTAQSIQTEKSTCQSLSLNGYTLGFYTPTQKLEPLCAV